VPLLSWSGVYVGALPWLALATLQALYLALLGALLPAALRLPPSLAALAVAGLWVGQEALRDRTPYGGFPWGRLAFSQADSPFTPLAAIGGAPLVSFAVALAGALLGLAALALLALRGRPTLAHAGVRAAALSVLAAVVATGCGLLVALPTSGRPVQWRASRATCQRPAWTSTPSVARCSTTMPG
jgi:apolipoprotein N-acyltransferase